MNIQEIFNKVVKGLASQGFKPSYSRATGKCMYRSHEGLKCAVGHLISDENYDPSFENKSILSSQVAPALEKEGIVTSLLSFHNSNPFLCDLQKAHDKIVEGTCGVMLDSAPLLLKKNLISVASVYGLELPDELK